MAEQETYTVIATVTREQYERLKDDSESINLFDEDQLDEWQLYGEREIPDMVHRALMENEGSDDWPMYNQMDRETIESYIPAVMSWPFEVRLRMLSHLDVYRETENFGTVHYSTIDVDVDALFTEFPQLREMFKTDPSEVAGWFA